MNAEDRTEDPPANNQQMNPIMNNQTSPTSMNCSMAEHQTSIANTVNTVLDTSEYLDSSEQPEQFTAGCQAAVTNGNPHSPPETILQLDDSDPVDLPPTHLALVLKRRKIVAPSADGNLETIEDGEEETYAFVDLKYFQPLSANQYVMKSQVIEPSAALISILHCKLTKILNYLTIWLTLQVIKISFSRARP